MRGVILVGFFYVDILLSYFCMIQKTQKFLSKYTLQNSEISELRDVLAYHSQKYYAENNPEISDEEFDILFTLLKTWEEKFPDLQIENSPSQKIIGGISSGFQKSKHIVPMISLDNVFSHENLDDWEARFQKILEKNNSEILVGNSHGCSLRDNQKATFIVEPKFDGLGISCVYEYGKLVREVTRGDGEEGENVTKNILTIAEIPRELPVIGSVSVPDIFEIRGEIVMKKSDFQALNSVLESQEKKTFSNPRNAAAGSLRQLDSSITKSRKLSVFFYQSPLEHKNYSEVLKFFEHQQVKIPHSPHYSHCQNIEEVKIAIQEISDLREKFDFEIDGAVVKIDEQNLRDIIGSTGHHPRWAIAWKFPATKVSTLLNDVEWQVGRTGTLTPVAHLEPVDIDGVMVARATLHNADYIQEKNLKIGDRVTLERSGDVIPKILFPHLSARTGDEKNIKIPENCPNCGEKVLKIEGEVAIKCVNKFCSEILKYSLFHFASKKAMNIIGLGKEVSEKIIEAQLISEISDLYDLEISDFLRVEGFQEKSAEKLFFGIQKSKQNELWRLINAFGIPLIGVKTAKVLAKQFISLKKIQEASLESLENIDDVGEKGAQKIFEFFKQNHEVIQKFLDLGISSVAADTILLDVKQCDHKETPLQGKTFVFTGSLTKFSRDEAGDLVENSGGKVLSSVSKNLDYLVYGEKAGSKKTKAEKLGISLLTEEEFLKMIKMPETPEISDAFALSAAVTLEQESLF